MFHKWKSTDFRCFFQMKIQHFCLDCNKFLSHTSRTGFSAYCANMEFHISACRLRLWRLRTHAQWGLWPFYAITCLDSVLLRGSGGSRWSNKLHAFGLNEETIHRADEAERQGKGKVDSKRQISCEEEFVQFSMWSWSEMHSIIWNSYLARQFMRDFWITIVSIRCFDVQIPRCMSTCPRLSECWPIIKDFGRIEVANSDNLVLFPLNRAVSLA